MVLLESNCQQRVPPTNHTKSIDPRVHDKETQIYQSDMTLEFMRKWLSL